jgi:hypothetical protein
MVKHEIRKKMKTKTAILVIGLFMLGGLCASANNFTSSENKNQAGISYGLGSADQVKVTATTNNENGQNSTVNLKITGSTTKLNNYVIFVEYNDGNDWKRIQYYYVIGQKGKYYVILDSKVYYFEY